MIKKISRIFNSWINFFIFICFPKKILRTYHSQLFGKIKVLEDYKKVRSLEINYFTQGVSINNYNQKKDGYWYTVAHLALNHCQNKLKPNVLILGLGANTISNFINLMNKQINQTIVEIEPLIIQACSEYFGLNDIINKKIINSDIYKLLQEESINKKFKHFFDVVDFDIFSGSSTFFLPEINKPNYIYQISRWMKFDGLFIVNRPNNSKKEKNDNQKIIDFLKTIFQESKGIKVIYRGFYENLIIIAKNLKFI